MPSRNGVSMLPTAHRRLSLRSETLTYELEDEDGKVVALKGYQKGPGCPLTVLIEVDEALATLAENEPTDDERPTFHDDGSVTAGALSLRRYTAKAQYAERTLRRMMLQAVIPGLTVEQANVLGSDDGPWRDMLVELGWRRPDDEPQGDDDAGEAAPRSAPSTGAPGSPASASPSPAEIP